MIAPLPQRDPLSRSVFPSPKASARSRPLRFGLVLLTTLFACVVVSSARAETRPLPSTSDMPASITVGSKVYALKTLTNPLREDAVNLDKHIRAGGEVYFKHCYQCHGDLLDGDGVFGDRFLPPPADFTHEASILTLPESYAFWRIIKGGPGLPEKFAPWDSAMPAWENQLDETQIWQVILYIFSTAGEKPAAESGGEPSVARGKELYFDKCANCHGETGKGDGPAAASSSPRPRKFHKGQYKFRSTPFGKIPTDQDLFNMLRRKYPGTTMPDWSHLSETDRWSLVLYLKTLSKKFQRFIDKGKKHKIVSVPEPPPFNLDSLTAGKELYMMNCSGCHGVKGRSDGTSTKKIVDIATDAIYPRNLTKPWLFRRGSARKHLFLTLRTGLSGTAMPRFSDRVFKDQKIWDMVHYVETLSPPRRPQVRPRIKVNRIVGELPATRVDPLWNHAESFFIPLGGQILAADKAHHPTVQDISVKALHNGDSIALYLHWDDPSVDPILKTLTSVEESPPPPLPLHLQIDEGEEDAGDGPPEAQKFPDSVAVQFPAQLASDGTRPYFLNGDARHPVNLWKWNSFPLKSLEMNARGLTQWNAQPANNQALQSNAVYEFGRYHLVIQRKLKTLDFINDIQFSTAQPVPIAFNVWDGSQGETGTKKAISSWFELMLEEKALPEAVTKRVLPKPEPLPELEPRMLIEETLRPEPEPKTLIEETLKPEPEPKTLIEETLKPEPVAPLSEARPLPKPVQPKPVKRRKVEPAPDAPLPPMGDIPMQEPEPLPPSLMQPTAPEAEVLPEPTDPDTTLPVELPIPPSKNR